MTTMIAAETTQKVQCTINTRSAFFTQRIVNVWDDLPVNIY